MTARRIAVIGAGSGYMPGVIRGLLARAADLRGSELVFHDIDAGHVALMATLARHMFAAASAEFTVVVERDLAAALRDVDFVFTTFRPGGLAARELDETIPLRHGVVGQETAGPGGFFMACRSIPVLLRIARLLERCAPNAWIVNYTNPTNIVTDAVLHYTGANIVGLCDQHAGDQAMWASLLGWPAEHLEVDWVGLNHATWGERLRVAGQDVSGELPDRLTALDHTGDATTDRLIDVAAALGLLPNSYARYYYFHDTILAEIRARGRTRARDIMDMLPGYYAGLELQARRADPDPSRERGGGDHGEFAIDTICAIAGDERRRLIVNTASRDAIVGVETDAVVELPAEVGADGPIPLPAGELPRQIRGLTLAVHEYEGLVREAAVRGDRRIALRALLAHPFVREVSAARAILDEGLAAHRAHLPQFG